MSERIPVSEAQRICEAFGKDLVVIAGYDRASGDMAYATFGRTARDKDAAANLSEVFSRAAGGDESGRRVFEDFRDPSQAAVIKEQRDALLAAAEEVMTGLNARIDVATAAGGIIPVFTGVAALHTAICKARGEV